MKNPTTIAIALTVLGSALSHAVEADPPRCPPPVRDRRRRGLVDVFQAATGRTQ